MKINVTAEHIIEGKPRNSNACPIALAIQSQIDGDVRVNLGSIEIHTPAQRFPRQYLVEAAISEWILAFDREGYVDPFSMALDRGEFFRMEGNE